MANTVTINPIEVDVTKSIGALRELQKEINKLKGSLRETEQGSEEYNAILARTARLQREFNSTISESGAATSRYEREQARVIQTEARRDMRQRIRDNIAAAGSIDQLSARLTRLRNVLDSMNDGQKARWGESFTNEINRIDTIVKESDFGTGRFNRNVGNYASGFGQLGFQVQQVARELPSLTVSASQFFLAISNNLPMLVDQFNRAKIEYAALKAEGKQGVPVWRQLTRSIFSWQTALVVSITIVTAFGKEIGELIKSLGDGAAAAITLEKAVRDINKAMEFDDLGTKIAEFERLRRSWVALGDDANARTQFLKDYRTEINNTGIAVNNVNDADNLFIKNSQSYIQSLILRAKAQAGVSLASKQYTEAIQLQVNSSKRREQQVERLNFLEKQSAEYTERGALAMQSAAGTYYNTYALSRDELINKARYAISTIDDEIDALNRVGDTYIQVSGDISKKEQELLVKAGLDPTDDEKAQRDVIEKRKLTQAELESEAFEFWLGLRKETEQKKIEARKAIFDSARSAGVGEEAVIDDGTDSVASGASDELELTKLQILLDAKLISYQEYYDQLQALAENSTSVTVKENAKQSKSDKAKKDAQQALLKESAKSASAVGDIFAQNTVANKALNAAGAVMDTWSAANATLRAYAGIPGPMKYIEMAGVIATGIKNVQKIFDTKIKGESGGGGGISIPTPNVGALYNIPIQDTRSVLTSTEEQELQANNRVYVVESDIREVGNRVRVVENEATFR